MEEVRAKVRKRAVCHGAVLCVWNSGMEKLGKRQVSCTGGIAALGPCDQQSSLTLGFQDVTGKVFSNPWQVPQGL